MHMCKYHEVKFADYRSHVKPVTFLNSTAQEFFLFISSRTLSKSGALELSSSYSDLLAKITSLAALIFSGFPLIFTPVDSPMINLAADFVRVFKAILRVFIFSYKYARQ